MPNNQDLAAQPIDLTRTRLWWGIFFGWWTVLMFLFTAQVRLSGAFRGDPQPWGDALTIGALDAYTWAILALAAIWLSRRLPLETTNWTRLLAVHLAVAVILVVGRLGFFYVIAIVLQITSPQRLGFWERILIAFPTNLLGYLLLVGVGYTLEVFRRFRERELAAAQLEARVANAQLQLLTNQLQPRFVFTALRSISTLMHRDVRAADRTLALLGDLLRTTLQKGNRDVVTLREEIEFLELYLQIEQARFGDRLCVEWRIRPELMELPVPYLILQPLVENAIRCGARPERIMIGADAGAGSLILTVRDSCGRQPVGRGAGLQTSVPAPGDGEPGATAAAIAHTEARLAQLYGGDHRFHVCEVSDGGTLARIELPLAEECPETVAETAAESRHPVGVAW
jgi:two-component system, LytTR family, sensor kinase